MKTRSIFMFLLVLALFSCRDETMTEETTKVPIGEETNFDISVYGKVIDTNGDPVGSAEITGDGQTLYADDNGLFLFDKLRAGNLGTQISAVKEGYLYGGFRLYADDDGSNRVEIVMMEARDLGSVTSAGAKINITDKTSVTFPADAFTLNGTDPYSGTVNIYGNWIDPTSAEVLNLTPGDLSGVNAGGDRVILNTFGMMGVELRTDTGEEVQIMDGKTAELAFEVPSEILSYAPTEIPLWTFDEEMGIWIQEGKATLSGNTYVGTVEHFSWWNCDLPYSILPFCIKVTDSTTGFPLANTKVYFDNLDGFGQAWGFTDNRGFLCGFLPEGIELSVTVGDAFLCPGQLPTKIVGPFTQADLPLIINCPVDLGDIIVNTVSGTVSDCTTGEPVVDAFVLFEWDNGNEAILTDDNGNYTQELISCSDIDELEIKAIDLVSEKEAQLVLTDLSGGSFNTDLTLCDDFVASNWFITSANGFVMFDDVVAKVKPNETIVNVLDNGSQEVLGFVCTGVGPCEGSYYGSAGAFAVDLEITEYGNIGQSIKADFSGTDNNGDAITGSFVAERIE